jgi:heme-degrading protein
LEVLMNKMNVIAPAAALALAATLAVGDGRNDGHEGKANCQGLPSKNALRALLNAAPGTGGDAGGIFHGTRMWGAVVNRDGELCAYVTGGSPEAAADPRKVWPVSQAIAKAKAYMANGLSLDDFVLSTARTYTLVQPGHSLFGLNHSNPFEPAFVLPPSGKGPGKGQITGGMITFGGGVGLYADGKIVGGLGVSGDTACADHEIAKRVRNLAGLNPPGGPLVDDIQYSAADGPSVFSHPACLNTWRNGVKILDDEADHPPAY